MSISEEEIKTTPLKSYLVSLFISTALPGLVYQVYLKYARFDFYADY